MAALSATSSQLLEPTLRTVVKPASSVAFALGTETIGGIGVGQADAGEAAQRRIAVEVDVHVDQAGQQRDAGQLDDLGGGGDLQLVARADAGDDAVLDDDGGVLDHAAGRDVEHAVGRDVDVLRQRSRSGGGHQAQPERVRA